MNRYIDANMLYRLCRVMDYSSRKWQILSTFCLLYNILIVYLQSPIYINLLFANNICLKYQQIIARPWPLFGWHYRWEVGPADAFFWFKYLPIISVVEFQVWYRTHMTQLCVLMLWKLNPWPNFYFPKLPFSQNVLSLSDHHSLQYNIRW